MNPSFDAPSPLPRSVAIRSEVRGVLRVLKRFLVGRCGKMPCTFALITPVPGGIGLEPAPDEPTLGTHDTSWENQPVALIEIERQRVGLPAYKFTVAVWIRWDSRSYLVEADIQQGLAQRFAIGGCPGSDAHRDAFLQIDSLLKSILYRLQAPAEFVL